MKKTITIALIITLLAAAAWADWGGRGPGNCDVPRAPRAPRAEHWGPNMGGFGYGFGQGAEHSPGIRGILRHADEINLTGSQREQLEQIMVDHQMARVETEATVKKAQIRVRSLMWDKDAAESEVMRAIDEAARVKADRAKQMYQHRKQVMTVLTEAQFEQLEQIREEWREDRRESRGKGSKGDGPQFRGRNR